MDKVKASKVDKKAKALPPRAKERKSARLASVAKARKRAPLTTSRASYPSLLRIGGCQGSKETLVNQ